MAAFSQKVFSEAFSWMKSSIVLESRKCSRLTLVIILFFIA